MIELCINIIFELLLLFLFTVFRQIKLSALVLQGCMFVPDKPIPYTNPNDNLNFYPLPLHQKKKREKTKNRLDISWLGSL